MTPELWQRLKPLYHAALDQPTSARDAFVTKACPDDPELATALRKLLQSAEGSSHAFASPVHGLSSLLFPRPAILSAGTLLAQRFRIVRHLCSGGMGDVYEALDEQMEGSRIALKTIRPSIARNAAALARFKDEVRLARKVSGPNVCRIHELYLTNSGSGPDDDHTCTAFLTMELLEGVTLHQRLAESHPLPVGQLKQLAAQLCTALDCIHQAGIVHQDLKPGNIMLVPHNGTERAVVTDFGLARTAVQTEAFAGIDMPTAVPGSALIAGTPSYMAPEQFEGREVTPATDIYALGIILYELATGVQPYAAKTPLAAAIRRSKPPTHASALRADLPPGWDNVISCCLQYDAEQRYRSAPEVAAALQHRGKIAVPLGRKRRVLIPTAPLVASCLLALTVFSLGLWFTLLRPKHRELAPDTARWYVMGMAALREGSYLKATRLLTMVTERDPTYALAHAALADAWTELDFTDTAQREMLLASAPDEQRGLNSQERRYIDAVRTTLVRDYSAATQDYEAILQGLPKDSKAQGYVDLGRIYEKAGKVHETMRSYEQAARLNPDDPAPFLHLGILRSRQRDKAGAATAFSKAEELYSAESNQEGLAEVAYQRGYAANDEEDATAANQYLNQSLTIARQIPSVQLEVRSLAQLSSVAYNNNKDDQAIQLANQVITSAREHGLEYWVSDGLVRLGNAQLDKEDYAGAEASVQEALHRAKDASHPRLEATATFSLASLRSQQHRWGDVLHYAQASLVYFRDYGFSDLSDEALVLMTRAYRGQGEYARALTTETQLLNHAEQTNRQAYVLLAEKTIGFTLFRLQRYPEALQHFDHALQAASQVHQNDVFVQVARADLLWQLGRYVDAQSALESMPAADLARSTMAPSLAQVKISMLASRGDTTAALALVDQARSALPTLRQASPLNSAVSRTATLAALDLGRTVRAKADASLLPSIHAEPDNWENAQNELTRAILCLRTGDAAEAKGHAEYAESFFSRKGIEESDALSLLVEADAANALHDQAIADIASKKSIDIFRHLKQSWGDLIFRQYLSRPDRQQTIRNLARLRATHGDTLSDLTASSS